MKYSELVREIKRLYDSGENIMQYFKNLENIDKNSTEAILISYDLQAGTYIKIIEERKEFNKKATQALADILSPLGGKSVMEIGVGEATTFCNVIEKMPDRAKQDFYGFDLSWSRIRYAQQYAQEKGLENSYLFTGDLFNIPIQDNAIDIVYTFHSIEPNGGREKEALKELYRVTGKYLVLCEPAYELAEDDAKARMERLGYVQNLSTHAKELGMNVIEHRLFGHSINPMNPTGLLIIEKNPDSTFEGENVYACPVTKAPLSKYGSDYFCKDSLLLYPTAGNVANLLPNNAIVASHYKEFL